MIQSWLWAAERIEHLATVGRAKTIGLISISGDAGVSTLSQTLGRMLAGGKTQPLLVTLTSPVQHATSATVGAATGGFVWDRTKAGDDGCGAIVARPTTETRFLYNDVSLLQESWKNELGSYSKLILDLPPVFHRQNDLNPLAAAASCDAVFLVCMQGRTMRSQLAQAVALLRASRVPLVGIVVNARDYPGAVGEIAADWIPVAAEEDSPERSAVRKFVQAAWRRRYLILIPILVMLPLSVVAAKLLPVPYVATSLLLLQEPGIEGPSGIAFTVSERIEERIPGLEALLKSSRVLSPALANLRKAGLAPPGQKGAIRDLQDRLSMKLLGLDILQINLKGDAQHGLGDQLKEVVTRFLESLTDQGALTAGELLVQDRRAAWERAAQAYAAAQAGPAGTAPERTGLNDVKEDRRSEMPQLQADVASTQQQYAALDKLYGHDSAEHPQRLLDAPERIRIIDPPSDPETPETSRALYVLFGVAASVALGIALAWAVERTDTSLRDLRDFSAVGGIPVVARLPRFTALDVASRKRRSPRSRLLSISSLFILVVLLFLLWLRLGPVDMTASVYRLWGGVQ